jgi:hypothetical protein
LIRRSCMVIKCKTISTILVISAIARLCLNPREPDRRLFVRDREPG